MRNLSEDLFDVLKYIFMYLNQQIRFNNIRVQYLYLKNMDVQVSPAIKVKRFKVSSLHLNREVILDCYFPDNLQTFDNISLCLVNDGQDLVTMKFERILDNLISTQSIESVLTVGIHCSTDRKNEYGTARILDYKGRGAKAFLYNLFVMNELIPFLRKEFKVKHFKSKTFAGFSLGGLCALDIVWNFPQEFTQVGVFSGSLVEKQGPGR